MEADLRRAGVRYTDRWRFDADGRRLLTLREIAVLVKHLPADSAVVRALNGGSTPWGVLEYLTADVFHATTGKPHPGRPKTAASKARTPDRKRKLRDGLRRKRAREAAIAAGEIT